VLFRRLKWLSGLEFKNLDLGRGDMSGPGSRAKSATRPLLIFILGIKELQNLARFLTWHDF